MNYKHVYHAGNFADIAKHLALVYCLDSLKRKEGGFFALDTPGPWLGRFRRWALGVHYWGKENPAKLVPHAKIYAKRDDSSLK